MFDFLVNFWCVWPIIGLVISIFLIKPFYTRFFSGALEGFAGSAKAGTDVLEAEYEEGREAEVLVEGAKKVATGFLGPIFRQMWPIWLASLIAVGFYIAGLIGAIGWIVRMAGR